jgi:hypothetical protein
MDITELNVGSLVQLKRLNKYEEVQYVPFVVKEFKRSLNNEIDLSLSAEFKFVHLAQKEMGLC